MGFISDKQVYRFERFIAKGGMSIFYSLVFVFVISFIALILMRGFFMLFEDPGAEPDFWSQVWRTFLEMTDPGNMNQDNDASTFMKVATIAAGMTGVIIFSMLIAFITTTLENILYEFRKGRGTILEKNHTLILGWNERVVDILRELIIANESESKASVVILSSEDKSVMDDEIIKRLPNTQTTDIITTSGNPALNSELKRVSVDQAKSVIILTSCSDNSSQKEKALSDIQSMKVVVALLACQQGENKIPIIVELFSEEKRTLLDFFRAPNLISINSWRIMGKLLFQTSLTSGLAMVYNEILSFAGNEVYFYRGKWPNKQAFGEMAYHFEDGIPMGVYRQGEGVKILPPKDFEVLATDELIILSNDDSAINYSQNPIAKHQDHKLLGKTLEKVPKRILILGWHELGSIFATESKAYLLEGSVIDVMAVDPTGEVSEQVDALNDSPNVRINHIETDPMTYEILLAASPFSYDNVVILSQELHEESSEKIDSDTLMLLFMLRRIQEETNADKDNTIVMTQVLNSQNQELIVQTDVDDFIVSNRFITMFLAQLSEQPRIKQLYEDIFKEDGSEIYVKPTWLYFDDFSEEISFADMIDVASQRHEICLGFRIAANSNQPEKNFGIQLNVPKNNTYKLGPKDFLVVLAEDEL